MLLVSFYGSRTSINEWNYMLSVLSSVKDFIGHSPRYTM